MSFYAKYSEIGSLLILRLIAETRMNVILVLSLRNSERYWLGLLYLIIFLTEIIDCEDELINTSSHRNYKIDFKCCHSLDPCNEHPNLLDLLQIIRCTDTQAP